MDEVADGIDAAIMNLLAELGYTSSWHDRVASTLAITELRSNISYIVQMVVADYPLQPSMIVRDMRRRFMGDESASPLYVVDSISDSVRQFALQTPSVNVIAFDASEAVVRGVRAIGGHRLDSGDRPLKRPPWLKMAIYRVLPLGPAWSTQRDLASWFGASTGSVSEILQSLQGPDDRYQSESGHRKWLELFRTGYPGPRGEVSYWSGSGSPYSQAIRASDAVRNQGAQSRISGALAAQLWIDSTSDGPPEVLTDRAVDLAGAGFTRTSIRSGSLRLVAPADKTLWPSAQAWQPRAPQIDLADPVYLYWNELRSFAHDGRSSAARLRQMLAS